ncbi:MAG: GDSL-type esterase/lipase family protein [Lachnospiraceae bacterium]|nr:GDSL-type esterase/lipase family protein [Lachnospiraceae bacterium]
MTKLSKDKRIWIIGAAIALVLCVAAVFYILLPKHTKISSIDLSGANFIQTMEAAPTEPIENTIFVKRKQALLNKFREHPDQLWSAFSDMNIVISGDSRGVGFSAYEYVDYNHNISQVSKTIYNIPENYELLKALNPKIVIYTYGINDLGLYGQYGVAQYITDLQSFVDTTRELIPGVDVYINSIPPCLPSEYARSPVWAEIPAWNVVIKKYCEEHAIHYIDIQDLCDSHPEMYNDDGVHFHDEFYPLWGSEIITQIVNDQINEG